MVNEERLELKLVSDKKQLHDIVLIVLGMSAGFNFDLIEQNDSKKFSNILVPPKKIKRGCDHK